MDHHKILYKDQRSYNSRQFNRTNRELLETNRCKQRRERFQDSRNISLSPTRHKKEVIIPICVENKNKNDANLQQNPNSTRLAKIVCNATNPEKLTKQEAFIKRFVEWKENKKKLKKQVEITNKRKPFVSAVNSGRQTTTSSSLVPRGHHKEFRPPVGLQNPISKEKVTVQEKKNPVNKGRQSIYTVVPTPPKKQLHEKSTNKFPISIKAKQNNSGLNKTLNCATNITRNPAKSNASKLNKTPKENKSIVKKSPAIKSTAKVSAVNLVRTLEKLKKPKTTTSELPLSAKDLIKPRAFKMPPPPISTKSDAFSNKQAGAISKIRNMKGKLTEDTKRNKKSPLKSGGARLAQSFKAKKALNTKKKVTEPAIKMKCKKLLNILQKDQTVEDMVIQTPKDFFTLNPFEKFVTSTRIKDCSEVIENVEALSIETSHKQSRNNSSAKRKIMQEEKTILPKEPIQNAEKTNDNGLENVTKKYNFIRYSEMADVDTNDHNGNDEMQVRPEERIVLLNENDKTVVHTSAIDEKTPTKSNPEEIPVNYLSPFVSVSRGKVSLIKEKEKRNSIYLHNATEFNYMSKESIHQSNSPKYSVDVRRTLEAVRYFRKQLQDEIDRLHEFCNVWEEYKKENLEKIQNANGEDMINVAIGQTRLLTSRKFMQFKGLIDRCEAGVTGIGAVEYDGSEDTKPITTVDLEGFWSMLGLQVNNLDERFNNLNRWKLNDWKDPDEVKPQIKKNSTKVKKAKAGPLIKVKPNSALQQMMRKMQAEMRNNKIKNDNFNEDGILTPLKLRQRRSTNNSSMTTRKSVDINSSRRISIVVKDRKYFSPAATVISVSSPNCRVNRKHGQSLYDSPKIVKHLEKFNEAFDSMELSLGLRKSVLTNENSMSKCSNPQLPIRDNQSSFVSTTDNKENYTSNTVRLSPQTPHYSPVLTGRKSILKTPGTAKSKLRNVIFNEKLRVKKFNFLINENGEPFNAENEDADLTHEEDLAKSCEENPNSQDSPQRTITLRNRKVRLRPSCEIVIPH